MRIKALTGTSHIICESIETDAFTGAMETLILGKVNTAAEFAKKVISL